MKEHVVLRKGTYELHGNPNFNFQLNRTILWGGGDLEDVRSAANNITGVDSWEKALSGIGEKAFAEGRVREAIAYWRMAEFFMFDDNPRKMEVYRRARDLFYSHHKELFRDGIVAEEKVPYEKGYLPVLHVVPEKGDPVDTIILHGGYDSYMEEFLDMVLYLRERGFAVYLFEGPGQGAALREYGLHFTHEWEKPVGALLDYFHLDNVTIIGLSLGGMLAPRAAAFDSRIARVVGWSIFTNFFDVIISTRKRPLQLLVRFLMKCRMKGVINMVMRRQMKKDPLAEWGLSHGMFALDAGTPYEYLLKADSFQIFDIAHRITGDFLLLGAEKDHFIPLQFYKEEIDALKNVSSLTFRLFTERESAQNHCNAGNPGLVLDTIASWIAVVKKHTPNK
jgi:pimeloyl-ACP methyl ester carboxylesterase